MLEVKSGKLFSNTKRKIGDIYFYYSLKENTMFLF